MSPRLCYQARTNNQRLNSKPLGKEIGTWAILDFWVGLGLVFVWGPDLLYDGDDEDDSVEEDYEGRDDVEDDFLLLGLWARRLTWLTFEIVWGFPEFEDVGLADVEDDEQIV